MKKLDVSGISDTAQMKLKSGTLQFLQDANVEAFAAIVQGLIGSTYNASKIYVLWGCVNSGSGNSFIISAGAVFYAGEVFLIDAVSFTVSGTAVFSIVTTQYTVNADPCTLSDTSVVNIHNIRKMTVGSGVSGSFNYASRVVLSLVVPAQLNLTGAGVTGSYPDYEIPGANGKNPTIAAGTLAIGNVPGGGQQYTASFPDLGTANYYISGQMISLSPSNPDQDTSCIWSIRNRRSNGFDIWVHETGNWTQNISFEYQLIAK